MITLILFFALTLTGCTNNDSQAKVSDTAMQHFAETTKPDSTYLYTGWYYVTNNENGFKRQLDKSAETFFIDPTPIVTAKNFTTFEIYESNPDRNGEKYLGLAIQLDKTGTENWSIATEKAIGNYLAFILDDQLLHISFVNSQITLGVTALYRGDYSREELEKIKSIIESEK